MPECVCTQCGRTYNDVVVYLKGTPSGNPSLGRCQKCRYARRRGDNGTSVASKKVNVHIQRRLDAARKETRCTTPTPT